MALSKLFVAVKKSIVSKGRHNPLLAKLGFQVRRLPVIDNGLTIETAMDTGRLPPGKMVNRARGFDQQIDECLLILRFDDEDFGHGISSLAEVVLGDPSRFRRMS